MSVRREDRCNAKQGSGALHICHRKHGHNGPHHCGRALAFLNIPKNARAAWGLPTGKGRVPCRHWWSSRKKRRRL